MKKKFLFVLIIAVIGAISLTAFSATASSGVTLEDIDFTYSGMSSEKAAQIVQVMFGIQDDSAAQPHFFCISHNIRTGTISTTQHRVHAANTRCVLTTSHVEYCTRANCNHFVVVRETTMRLICC